MRYLILQPKLDLGPGLGAVPVHGDAEEVEDGGCGEDHVEGVVHVAQPHREHPVPVQQHVDGVKHHGAHRHGQVCKQ